MEHADDTFERQAAALVGRRIYAVRYFALTAGGEQGWASGGDRFDTPEFGVDLDLDGAQTIALTWAVGPTGLELLHGSLTHALSDPGVWAVWDVSDRPQWATHLGKEIVQVDVRQEQIFTDDPTLLPLCITLTFRPDDRIYICAAQYFDEGDLLIVGGDEIVIFFRDDMVRRYYPDLLAR